MEGKNSLSFLHNFWPTKQNRKKIKQQKEQVNTKRIKQKATQPPFLRKSKNKKDWNPKQHLLLIVNLIKKIKIFKIQTELSRRKKKKNSSFQFLNLSFLFLFFWGNKQKKTCGESFDHASSSSFEIPKNFFNCARIIRSSCSFHFSLSLFEDPK